MHPLPPQLLAGGQDGDHIRGQQVSSSYDVQDFFCNCRQILQLLQGKYQALAITLDLKKEGGPPHSNIDSLLTLK